jgi:hypothetical protein
MVYEARQAPFFLVQVPGSTNQTKEVWNSQRGTWMMSRGFIDERENAEKALFNGLCSFANITGEPNA